MPISPDTARPTVLVVDDYDQTMTTQRSRSRVSWNCTGGSRQQPWTVSKRWRWRESCGQTLFC